MKKFTSGVVIGILIGLLIGTTTLAVAGDAIKLIINGKEINCDVPPQVINGRTMVPARYVAEELGATVEWDADNNAVVITGAKVGGVPTDLTTTTVPKDFSIPEIDTEKTNSEWIVSSDLSDYGCSIGVTLEEIFVTKGDKKISFAIPIGDYTDMGIYQALPNLQVMFKNGHVFYNKIEIFQLLDI